MKKTGNMLITAEITVKQALKRMDEAAEKILFVTDRDIRLVGTVTDGDIRRHILKEGSLNVSIASTMNPKPISIEVGFSKGDAKEIMVSKAIDCLPVVDKSGKVVSAIRWLDLFEKHLANNELRGVTAVIMAGGTGSRLAPVTSFLPKPLIPIGDKPIAEMIMEKFSGFGCKDFYFSINFKANLLKAYFNEFKHVFNVNYVQEGKPLGTIGSLHLIGGKIKKPFFVSNCDILIDADYADIYKFHRENKNKITMIVSMKHYTIPYGVCEIGFGGRLKSIREKPEYDFLVSTGFYVMEPDVIQDIPINKFYHVTDLIADYTKRKKKIGVYPVSEKSWFDMGEWQEFQKMFKKFGKEGHG
jgi:dTDP-glucose pyrophosphorylase